MAFCEKCGNQLNSTAVFCPNCGAPVLTVESEVAPTVTDLEKTRQRQVSSANPLRPDHLPEGFVIDDRYVVARKLGQGGFGAVYLVEDRKLSVSKALKVIPEAVINDPEALDQLRREARVMLSLTHPNIVHVYDFHDEGSLKYIDMEYVDGKTLTELKLGYPERRIPEEEVLNYAKEIAAALEYAHSKNILHRDLKPQNVMVTESGEVKVMDFGIAETVRSSMSRIAQSTSSGTLVYMSPEQLRGKDVGKESDIYSYGALLYDLLAGHPPFFRGQIEYQILNEKPDEISGVTVSINALIGKCLGKEYRARYRTFGELLVALNHDQSEILSTKLDTPNLTEVIENRQQNEPVVNPEEKIDPQPPDPELAKLKMVLVKGGSFQMGSNKGHGDERPVHEVTISGFYMDKTPVTQSEYKRVMGANPSRFKNSDDCPVEFVSWYDAMMYCNKRSALEGLKPVYRIERKFFTKKVTWEQDANGYRLPTEAEWEYAARGGNSARSTTGMKYAGSNNINEVAWYYKNSEGKTHPVGQKKPNELGLYDMSGNVWEWCWDWYDTEYYTYSSRENPTGPKKGSYRVLRGGSWCSDDNLCRVMFRNRDISNFGYYNFGFRCVRGNHWQLED